MIRDCFFSFNGGYDLFSFCAAYYLSLTPSNDPICGPELVKSDYNERNRPTDGVIDDGVERCCRDGRSHAVAPIPISKLTLSTRHLPFLHEWLTK